MAMALCLSANTYAHDTHKASWVNVPQDRVESPIKGKLQEYAGKNQLDSVETRDSHGIKIYKATWTENGTKHRVTITEKGDLLKVGGDISSNAVPEKIKKIAQSRFGDTNKLTFAKESVVLFMAKPEGTVGERFDVSPTGRIYMHEHNVDAKGEHIRRTTIAVDTVPAATLAALKRYSGDNAITKAFTSKHGSENTYGIQWMDNGQTHTAIVLENGTLSRTEVVVSEDLLPGNVKMQFSKHFTKGEKLVFKKASVELYDIKLADAPRGEKNHLRLMQTGQEVNIQHSHDKK